MLCGLTGTFPAKEDQIQVLAGLAPSSQTVGALVREPLASEASKEIAALCVNNLQFGIFSITKVMFDKFSIWLFSMGGVKTERVFP